MATISRAEEKERPRVRGSLQIKFGLSYILLIAAVLVLLNTYPLIVSEDLAFRSKATAMENSVSVMVSALANLESLTEENVSAAMTLVAAADMSRILVTDAAGKVLYDTRESDGAVGDYALYTEVVQALSGNDAFTSSYRNGAFRSRAAAPVLYQNRIIGAVYAYEYDVGQAALLRGFQSNIRNLSIIVTAMVLVVSFIMSRALTGKISELLSAIRQVRAGAYSHRAAVRGHDEIAQIGDEFNRLTDRLQTTEDVRRRFVSDASHELKTPLAAIRLLTDSILQTENIDPATTREFVADIGREADRLSRISEDLLRLTRLDGGAVPMPSEVDVAPVLEQVLRMMELVAEARGIALHCDAAEHCRVLATKDELHQVLYNLVDNAVKYSHDGGQVRVSLRREGRRAVLTVADDGVGIPEEDLPRIFQRFYRVDKARSRAAGGTGLGLSIVQDTVKNRGGSVEAANRPQGGAIFTVHWPRVEEGGGGE
ncbi:HAMP domain-containing sensor histidine kinase [Oscillibacter sp.]|uniref:sensor histidine kinase n=1 Tax=Oscillibacter sp. TaxID=1945593 RepID=UPI002898DF7A|nr:HAMP domain-containing sensor histidine kinase [Oscillibacter sp.]